MMDLIHGLWEVLLMVHSDHDQERTQFSVHHIPEIHLTEVTSQGP